MRQVLLALGLSAAVALPALAQQPPAAPVRPVTDVYFGEAVVDGYRWMEARPPEFDAWMKAQDAVTRSEIAALPGRKALGDEIAAISAAAVVPSRPVQRGDQLYFQKRPSGAAVNRLYVRNVAGGPVRELIAPDRLSDEGGAASLQAVSPSPDNRYLAYTIGRGGSEDAVLHVMEIATGKVLAEAIDGTRFALPEWAPDSKSFYYSRLKALKPGDSPEERFKDQALWRHVVGEDPARDQLVFEASRPDSTLGRDGGPLLYWPTRSDWVFAFLFDGVSPYGLAWVSPASAVAAGKPVWRKIAGAEDRLMLLGLGGDQAAVPVVRGDRAWVATTLNAPLGRLIDLDLKAPDFANAPEIASGNGGALVAATPAADGLYVIRAQGGAYDVQRLGWDRSLSRLATPFPASIGFSTSDPDRPGAVLGLESWARPSELFQFTGSGPAKSLALAEPMPVDLSDIVIERIVGKAADGTAIPVDIMRLKSLKLDGRNPTMLEGYGAYGVSSDPIFSARLIPFVKRGGIYASAVVRGGGEYGEAWHLAGKEASKPNTWRDFIAAAEALIDKGYTSKDRLAGSGTSAGGILIGRAVTERPDLFAAAFMGVPITDTLRFETTPGGPANVAEFGSVATPEGYRALKAMSPLVHVVDGVRYPPILITAGMNDGRVPAWVPAKLAARLQAASTGGPVRLRVDFDAGHGIGSTKAQRDAQAADVQAFLFQALGAPDFQPKRP